MLIYALFLYKGKVGQTRRSREGPLLGTFPSYYFSCRISWPGLTLPFSIFPPFYWIKMITNSTRRKVNKMLKHKNINDTCKWALGSTMINVSSVKLFCGVLNGNSITLPSPFLKHHKLTTSKISASCDNLLMLIVVYISESTVHVCDAWKQL